MPNSFLTLSGKVKAGSNAPPNPGEIYGLVTRGAGRGLARGAAAGAGGHLAAGAAFVGKAAHEPLHLLAVAFGANDLFVFLEHQGLEFLVAARAMIFVYGHGVFSRAAAALVEP
jgi:hypothetical protein